MRGMLVYRFRIRDNILEFNKNFKFEVSINPKSVMKIENLVGKGIDGTFIDGIKGSSDSFYQIATLWDGTSYAIGAIDAYKLRWDLWNERKDM
jgi:hypothetical protein